MANTKVSYEMMQDVAKATEMMWGVKCSIQQCQAQAAWDIVISKYNPVNDLIYNQKETVTDFTIKSSKMPEYIFVVINDMVAKLNDAITKAQPLKDAPKNIPGGYESSAKLFTPKYYGISFSEPKVGDLPKPATAPWSNPVESKPVTSLKEMYEQDSPKKAKKVKKPKLTAAELVKQKEAAATNSPSTLPPTFKKWLETEFYKESPFYKALKDNKNQAAQGGAQQMQAPIQYTKTPVGEIMDIKKKMAELEPKVEKAQKEGAITYSILEYSNLKMQLELFNPSDIKIAEEKLLQEAQAQQQQTMQKLHLDELAPWTQADTEKVVTELKHSKVCPNKTKKAQK